jgi:UMF1 family MFS transporter
MVVFLPVLGAIADYTHLKKAMMAVFCYVGVVAGSLLFFVTDSYVTCSILFILSTMSFAASNVFYNAFLIDITTEDQRDKVSSYGYGLGYLSGFIMLAINLLFLKEAENLGISTGTAVRNLFRCGLAVVGVFCGCHFLSFEDPGCDQEVPQNKTLLTVGFGELMGNTQRTLAASIHDAVPDRVPFL